MPQANVQVPLGTITLNLTIDQLASTYSWLLAEMLAATPRLRPDERTVLRRIMGRASGSLTVGELFPHFTRESEEHKTLRRLRAAQFIRPANTGRWELDEPIEVKPFGELMWRQFGEESLFNDGAASGQANGSKSDELVLDLASATVHESQSHETVIHADEEEFAATDEDMIDLLASAEQELGKHT